MAGFDLPYFDRIIERLEGDPSSELAAAFRRHVHWGCYEEPGSADDSLESYMSAAENLTRRVCSAGEAADGQRILDVGCGFGGTLGYLDERLAGCRLVGLNIDGRQLARARNVVAGGGDNRISFVEADACRLPVAPSSQDVVLAVECIFHFPSRKQFFREAARALRPGGMLALSDFVLAPDALESYVAWTESQEIAESGFYGANRMPATTAAYGRMAEGTGFVSQLDDDLTSRTLPTYPAMRRLYAEAGLPDGARATDYLEALARQGWVQYRVMSFRRRPR